MASKTRRRLVVSTTTFLSILAGTAQLNLAQTPPASAPATNPTTGPARRGARVTTPKGYSRIDGQGRSIICLPADEAWVRRAVNRAQPGTATTKPSDLISNLGTKREALLAAMLKDLPTLKPSQVEGLIDNQVLPLLKPIEATKPRLVFVVSPAEHLKEALREGWTDPHFHYNAADDSLEVDTSITLASDGIADESAVSAVFRPTDTEDDRVSQLSQYVTSTETQVQNSITSRATSLAVISVAEFLAKQVFNDLPTKDDQIWLSVGLSNVLAARYVSIIHGSPLRQFIEALVIPPRDTGVNAATIDLLNPMPTASLKDEYVPPYLDARRRKAIAVMYYWLTEAGDAKLLPMITAVQRARPADGATLAEVVKTNSGVDLAPVLRAR
jgi:hypothetical protein